MLLKKISKGFENKDGLINSIKFTILHPIETLKYLIRPHKQISNWYYPMVNEKESIQFVSELLNIEPEIIKKYYEELSHNTNINSQLKHNFERTKYRDNVIYFGKRKIWYAIIRSTKPAHCIETGTHDGLGSSVILQALQENQKESGSPDSKPMLYSLDLPSIDLPIDIESTSGWAIPEYLRENLILRNGRSLDILKELRENIKIDFFLHDSDHAYEYEFNELELAYSMMNEGGLICSDNAHGVAFRDFCKKYKLKYKIFYEIPDPSVTNYKAKPGFGVAIYSS